MKQFIRDSLSNISFLMQGLPLDSILYGKPEAFVNSCLASDANRSLCYNLTQYYRTEFRRVDLSRFNNEKVEFMLESKFQYVSDLNEKCTTNQLKIIPVANKDSNFLECVVTLACYQLQNYRNTLIEKDIFIYKDQAVLLNLLFFPFGTNGYFEDNSGLKYITDDRLKYDEDLYEKLGNNIDNVLSHIVTTIKASNVITHGYNCINLKIHFQKSVRMSCCMGFEYFVFTICFTI